MTDSPKKRFLTTQHARRVLEASMDISIIAGLDAALLQMSYDSGAAKTPEAAAAIHWQLTGAYKFREIFLSIASPDKPFLKPKSDNLPHET